MKIAATCLLMAALLSGCTCSGYTMRDMWRPAAIDPESGRVIALRVQYKDRWIATPVTRDYGMFVLWKEKERGFYLFNAEWKSYFWTTDFDSFLAAIGRLPKGITLEWINTCTAGSCWNMPETERKRLDAALAAGDLRTDKPSIACTCESVGIQYPPIPM